MNKEEQEALKVKLREEIKCLEVQIESFKENSGAVEPDKALGRLSRLDEMNAKSVHKAALQNAQTQLQKTKYRLMTIGTPLYQG